jgi:hypothetical protein
VTDGETRERVDVTLARWGAMNGRVFDELGDPLQGVSVQLLQVRYQSGRRRLVSAAGAYNPTDDLGRFRVPSVQPGQYIVSAIVAGVSTAELPGYARSYFPGTPDAGDAQFVSVALPQEQSGIEFSLSRARTATISGTLLNAAGEPSTMGSVKLLPNERSGSVSVPVGARLGKDGAFEFPNVTSGQYVIQVDRGRRGSSTEGEFGALPIAVDGVDITDLVLRTSTGSSISGRVSLQSFLGTKTPAPAQMRSRRCHIGCAAGSRSTPPPSLVRRAAIDRRARPASPATRGHRARSCRCSADSRAHRGRAGRRIPRRWRRSAHR